MKHKEFVKKYAQKTGCTEQAAEQQIQAFIEIVLESMKHRDSLTIDHFGRFYIEDRSDSTVFKFTPAQRFKAILGWANTYKGKI